MLIIIQQNIIKYKQNLYKYFFLNHNYVPVFDEQPQNLVDEIKASAARYMPGKAMEAIARQPEASGDIRGGMILMAAFVEGAALIAILLSIFVK